MALGEIVTYTLLFISLYFEVFLLVSFLEKRAAPHAHTSPGELPSYPRVAVVVPCFNEGHTVRTTLASLCALEYPADKLEILVVDDGSTDNTLAVAQEFAGNPRIQILQKGNGGKHTAMNLALKHTSADIIGCLDADSVVEPDALLRIVPIFDNHAIAAVTPGIHVREPKTMLQHLQKVEYRLSIFNRFILAGLGSAFITPGPFSFFRASVVRELGGWKHGHSTEDLEMALRIQDAGHLIANAPAAIVHTTTPHTFKGLFNQRVRWTYGFLRNAIDYRYMFANQKFGNLGLLILPTALISIGAAIYFFFRIVWFAFASLMHTLTRVEVAGVTFHPSLNLFYINTSVLWFLVLASVSFILVLISVGSYIGTGSRKPPMGTPLFVMLYSFLAPLWLLAAVVRAVFRTGVRWR
jgi:cellulose synthase/poly-beta-1,6-N-acetylglucosamine synthase-like glycosyltransferase